MTNISALFLIITVYLIGILSISTAFIYIRLCIKKPAAAIAFARKIVIGEKGTGYLIKLPLGILKLEDSNLNDHLNREQQYIYWLNHLLVWLGFALPIYFTVTGFLKFEFIPFHWLNEDVLITIFSASFLCGGYLANRLLLVSERLAKYEALTSTIQKDVAEGGLAFGKEYFRITDVFRK